MLRDITDFWRTGLGGLDGVGEDVRLGERGVDVNGDAGGGSDDVVRGHAGVDSLMGDMGTDRSFGPGGRDDLSDTGSGDELLGGDGADVLSSSIEERLFQ